MNRRPPVTRYILDARTAIDHFPGIGRYTVNLARAMIPLLEATEELVLLQDRTRATGWNVSALAGEQVSVVDVPVSPFSLRRQWSLPRLLRTLKADLYHSPYYLMPYLPGVPSIVTIFDLIPMRYPDHFTRTERAIYRVTVSLAARVARRVIATSQATVRDLSHHIRMPEARIPVIPLAADPVFQGQCPAEIDRVRRKYELPERYVLQLSSNKPHKNRPRLVEAWALLESRAETRGYTLVLAGKESPRHPEVRDRVQALHLEGRVHVLGAVPDTDLPPLYAGADWFVFPSLYEGFGLPVLEAMACGTPVLCSNRSSLPEIVGDAAILFDPTDTEAMTNVLADALAEPEYRDEFSQRALRRALGFRWQQTAQLTYRLYKQVIEETGERHGKNP